MIVVDIETTGLNPGRNSLISIGAVDFYNPDNLFYGECRIPLGAEISEKALEINGFSKKQLHNRRNPTVGELVRNFSNWAKKSTNSLTLAGENVGRFDHKWLEHDARAGGIDFIFGYRTVDLHSLTVMDHYRRGIDLPLKQDGTSALSLDKTLTYVGLPGEPKPHNALTGAKYEAEAFSRLLHKKNLLQEFKGFPLPNYLM
jgi:DNA polymerase III epsilon subunit-like protein